MIRRIRRSSVSREEVIADVIFFVIPAAITLIALFFFDIHQSFYQAPYFPFSFLLNDIWVYVGVVLAGGLVGFFMIKLFLFGVKEEEKPEKTVL